MPRAIWSGAISFGLVNVPVKLFPAVRSHDLKFTQLNPETGGRVRRKRVDETTGEEVPYEAIVKGYEIADGRYVQVDPEELAGLAPEASRTIDLVDFVSLDEVDPIYIDRPYYLAPDGPAARKPYALLATAMERSGHAAVARFVMRTNEHLALVRAVGGVLVANTLHYADEVLDPSEVEAPDLGDVELTDRELEMAERLVESLVTRWEPEAYEDEHHRRVLSFLEDKAAGKEVVVSEPGEPSADVIDLMDALERSLAAAGGGDDATRQDVDDLADLSKSALYELAQAADLEGRSSMTKDELLAALRAAGVRRPRLREAG